MSNLDDAALLSLSLYERPKAPTLDGLPPEVFMAILDQVNEGDLQQTTLGLTRAIPNALLPPNLIFEHVRIHHPAQAVRLYMRLTRKGRPQYEIDEGAPASWVKTISFEAWTVDPEVTLNIIKLLSRLRALSIFIGNTFAPDHVQHMFLKPIPGLKFLSLRFRPYVKSVTYYQFLAGEYYDGFLIALSRWPSGTVPTLSLLQDPMDSAKAGQTMFAQPLVFFHLESFTRLLHSPSISSLKALRIRVPGRDIGKYITGPSTVNYLDLSTCEVRENDLDSILIKFTCLQHIVLDGCSLPGGRREVREGEWLSLGKRFAAAGIMRADRREKVLREWLIATTPAPVALTAVEAEASEGITAARARRGRRGLATAPISLRETRPRATTSRLGASWVPKVRILPTRINVKTIAISPAHDIPRERHAEIQAEFTQGWRLGMELAAKISSRFRSSFVNGTSRVVRFKDGNRVENKMDDLVDAETKDFHLFGGVNIDSDGNIVDGVDDPPLLCLAGPGVHDGHMFGCAHQLGWVVFRDEL